jgi:hypothetical protein
MQKRKLIIWRSYEPNRLAKNYLSDIYDKLINTTKDKIIFKKKYSNKIKGNL